MAANEVCYEALDEATAVDNESHEVLQMEEESHTKQKGEAKERKKTSGIWTYFEIDSSENKKAICLTCKEKVSRGGSKPTKFNTSNLRKHLMTHKDEYKRFVKDEKKREETAKKKGNDVELQQTTLESIVERRKSYSADHPRAKAIILTV